MSSNTLISRIQNTCLKYANKEALRFYRHGELETQLTYQQLNQDSNQMAHHLLGLGVNKGDRIILLIEKSVLFVVSHLALQKIEAICVPLNPGFKSSEISYFLDDATPSWVIAGTEQGKILQKINPGIPLTTIDPDTPYKQLTFFRSATTDELTINNLPADPGLIIYTSGTTGKPKGAVLTQENLFQDCKNIQEIWAIKSDDVLCHALPLFHIHGLCFALHTCLASGATILLLDTFDAGVVINMLSNKIRPDVCTLFMAVPAIYNKLIGYNKLEKEIKDNLVNFDHLRLITSGSAPLLIKDFKQIEHVFGQEPVEREGMSETGMNFSNPITKTKKPGSIGLPLSKVQVRVVDHETLTDVKGGKTGEFWLKSLAITPGYWEKPDETKKTFSDDWFRTGDLGYVDKDGYYFLTDRIKNIIISGGENISPKEIESIIDQLYEIMESAVVGIPDDQWGEKVVAAVVLKKEGSISEHRIIDQCKKHLHSWKCPKQIVFVKVLPKNTMGKILRDKVRLLF